MKKGNELLIFDRALNLYTHLGLPDDCIDSKIDFSILNLGKFPIEVPYSSPSYQSANFYSFVFCKKLSWQFAHRIIIRFKLLPGTVYFNNPAHQTIFID